MFIGWLDSQLEAERCAGLGCLDEVCCGEMAQVAADVFGCGFIRVFGERFVGVMRYDFCCNSRDGSDSSHLEVKDEGLGR